MLLISRLSLPLPVNGESVNGYLLVFPEGDVTQKQKIKICAKTYLLPILKHQTPRTRKPELGGWFDFLANLNAWRHWLPQSFGVCSRRGNYWHTRMA